MIKTHNETGISIQTLYKWRAEAEGKTGPEAGLKKGVCNEYQALLDDDVMIANKINRLEEENARPDFRKPSTEKSVDVSLGKIRISQGFLLNINARAAKKNGTGVCYFSAAKQGCNRAFFFLQPAGFSTFCWFLCSLCIRVQ